MSGVTLYCDGVVDVSTLACSTGWQTVVANPPFDYTQLDPAMCSVMYAGGFFVILPVWAAVYGLKKLLGLI